MVNLEHVAQFYFGVSNMAPFLVDLAKRGVERYGFNLIPEFTNSVPGDLGGYAPLGVERAARFYEFFVREAAAAPRNNIDP